MAKWREFEFVPRHKLQRVVSHEAAPRKIYSLERIIKVSGEVSPDFCERMRLMGVRVVQMRL